MNLQNATFYSDALGRPVPLRVTTRAIRTVQKVGGLDAFLVKTDDAKLPPEGLHLKRLVKKALRGKRERGGEPGLARTRSEPARSGPARAHDRLLHPRRGLRRRSLCA